jgi:AraC family transcriptional regulator of arabinose operon
MSDTEIKSRETASARLQPNGRIVDRRVLLAMMLVEEGTRHQFFIEDIAKAVNLSAGRLAHLFKSQVGVSPQRYLNSVRLEKGKELLERGGLSIKEIAAEIGIASVSRFCRSFKTTYGVTPNEYRKTHLRLDLKGATALLRTR